MGQKTAIVPPARDGLVKKWFSVLLHPTAFFETLREESQIGPPLKFAYLMVLVAWMLYMGLTAMVTSPLSSTRLSLPKFAVFMAVKMAELPLLAGFVGGLVIWGIGRNLGNPRSTYKQSISIACYSLAIIPLTVVVGLLGGLISPRLGLGQLLWLYGFYIGARGLIVLHKSKPIPTFVLVGVLAMIVEGSGYYALNHARAQPHPSKIGNTYFENPSSG